MRHFSSPPDSNTPTRVVPLRGTLLSPCRPTVVVFLSVSMTDRFVIERFDLGYTSTENLVTASSWRGWACEAGLDSSIARGMRRNRCEIVIYRSVIGPACDTQLHFASVVNDVKYILVMRVCLCVCLSAAIMSPLLHGRGCNLGEW